MSVSKWAYSPDKCDGDYCPGDCDYCDKAEDDDCISRKEAVKWLRAGCADEIYNLPSVTPQTRWIPIKTRPMTEEEKEEIGHEYAYMYDCPLPDDAQDVMITDCYGNVEVDTFYRDYEGCYFETNCDDGEVIAWMPLPQPYKAESKEE